MSDAPTTNWANVRVDANIKSLIRRAGLEYPPPGKQLAFDHVQERLTAAGLKPEDRLTVKTTLKALHLLQTTR